jgi:hypothetical protein
MTTEKASQNQHEVVHLENKENEALGQPAIIDPILIDITNKALSTPLQERGGATVTNHVILREAAQRDLENYTQKMVNQMNKGRKRPNHYEIGDLVRISVPKIDRFGTDRPMLPCKVLEKINEKYRLGSQFGVINVFYSHGEIDPLGVEQFPELEIIPTNTITVREAARLQSVGLTTGTICNCKGNCNSRKCNCRKMGNNCGSRCHGGRQCQNKPVN